MAPSSKLLDWKVVSVLLALRCDQLNWNPQQQNFRPKGTAYDVSTDWLLQYFDIVEASENEMGKMPILCDLLMKGISTYKKTFKKKSPIQNFTSGKSIEGLSNRLLGRSTGGHIITT